MTEKVVGIGHQDFKTVREKGCFYIDKTLFIKEWWEEKDAVTLITRPRRFGKTLNMSMVEKFFSVQYAGREDLFQGLKIWEDETFRKLQGTYPVLFISFANIKEQNYEMARKKICQLLSSLYSQHQFLLDEGALHEKEKDFFRSVSMEMDDVSAAMAIHELCLYLSRYYGRQVIILLDEYDTPMQEAYINGFWDQMVSLTRNIFNAAFKTNPYLERAIMTGITRVSKESVFSDLNHLEVVTSTSEKYAECFGFTEEEVFDALDEFGLAHRKREVKTWYDGFTFGSISDIYNPWSILNYLDKERLAAYWANSSSNSLVSKLLREGGKGVKQEFEQLMKGGHIEVEIDEQVIYDQLPVIKNAIWSLLLASGYLKVITTEFIELTGRTIYYLAVTNKEVFLMFKTIIHEWFEQADDVYNDFVKALLFGDLDAMNEYMNHVTDVVFSSFDTGKKPSKPQPERFYHGFVLGLMIELDGRYVLTLNRESGFGRYDIMLEPLYPDRDDGIVMEFKVFQPKKEKNLEDTAEAALQQIEDKKYDTALLAKGIPKERIRKYGFAFKGKEVWIGESLLKESVNPACR